MRPNAPEFSLHYLIAASGFLQPLIQPRHFGI
jgi:hypothetical protein